MALSCTEASVSSKWARKRFPLFGRLLFQAQCPLIDLALLATVSDGAETFSGTLTDEGTIVHLCVFVSLTYN